MKMHPILRNVLAVLAGCILGGVVNMAIVNLGHTLMPIEGVDTNDMESLAAAMPGLSFEYFIFPFLAHAIGTLVGAMLAALLGINIKTRLGLIVGVFFLLGGIMASQMLPAPTWFVISDLLLAYIPMGWLGALIADKIQSR